MEIKECAKLNWKVGIFVVVAALMIGGIGLKEFSLIYYNDLLLSMLQNGQAEGSGYGTVHFQIMQYLNEALGGTYNMLILTLPSTIGMSMVCLFTYLLGKIVSIRYGLMAVLLLFFGYIFLQQSRYPSGEMFVTAALLSIFYLLLNGKNIVQWLYVIIPVMIGCVILAWPSWNFIFLVLWAIWAAQPKSSKLVRLGAMASLLISLMIWVIFKYDQTMGLPLNAPAFESVFELFTYWPIDNYLLLITYSPLLILTVVLYGWMFLKHKHHSMSEKVEKAIFYRKLWIKYLIGAVVIYLLFCRCPRINFFLPLVPFAALFCSGILLNAEEITGPKYLLKVIFFLFRLLPSVVLVLLFGTWYYLQKEQSMFQMPLLIPSTTLGTLIVASWGALKFFKTLDRKLLTVGLALGAILVYQIMVVEVGVYFFKYTQWQNDQAAATSMEQTVK